MIPPTPRAQVDDYAQDLDASAALLDRAGYPHVALFLRGTADELRALPEHKLHLVIDERRPA